eukprot:scaffold99334_cov56-Attheya_sp.AAC.2
MSDNLEEVSVHSLGLGSLCNENDYIQTAKHTENSKFKYFGWCSVRNFACQHTLEMACFHENIPVVAAATVIILNYCLP